MSKKLAVLIYPIPINTNSFSSGGVSHCLSNSVVYSLLGYRIFVVCSFQYPLVSITNNTIYLHLLPVFRPISSISHTSSDIKSNFHIGKFLFPLLRPPLNALRRFYINLVIYLILYILRPSVVHQRANMVYLLPKKPRFVSKLLLEINDEYCPSCATDIIVSVPNLSTLYPYPINHLSLDWPVMQYNICEYILLKNNLCRLQSNYNSSVNFLYLGYMPISEHSHFHRWLLSIGRILSKSNSFFMSVDVYSGYCQTVELSSANVSITVQYLNFIPLESFNNTNYHAGLIFYSSERYSDDRLSFASPTKLSNYIDLSLPFISNRKQLSFSSAFLPSQVSDLFTYSSEDLYSLYIKYREGTLPSTYAQRLGCLIETK